MLTFDFWTILVHGSFDDSSYFVYVNNNIFIQWHILLLGGLWYYESGDDELFNISSFLQGHFNSAMFKNIVKWERTYWCRNIVKKKFVCIAKHTNWAFHPKIFLGRRISVPRHSFRSPSKVLGCILQIFDNFFIIELKIVVIMIITVIIIMIHNYWRVVKRKGNIIACARVNRRIFATFSRIFNDLTHRSRGRIYELNSKVEKAG